jgi:hypothetical protein
MLTDYNNADRILAIKIRKSRSLMRTVRKIELFGSISRRQTRLFIADKPPIPQANLRFGAF